MAGTLHIESGAAAQRPVRSRYAWSIFAIVFALMVVDYVDRQAVVAMFPQLKVHWRLSDGQLGGLVSVVSLVVAIGTVPLSMLADRWGRVKSMFVMALVWSSATIACAYARDYRDLLVARGLVGLGEAAYGSAGAALLASLFPARIRSTVLGAFLAAGVIGSVLGVVLGGVISQRWGWQAAFGAVGVPGLVLAALLFVVARHDDAARATRGRSRPPAGAMIGAFLKSRTGIVACMGAGLQLVVVSTSYAWLPSYFNRFYGLPPDQAGTRTGIVVLIGGVSAIVWSIVADRMTPRLACARLLVAVTVALATALLMFAAFALVPPGTTQLALIVAGAATMTGSIGPVSAVVLDVAHPAVRATAASVLALTQNLFGLTAGPLLTGLLSDAYGLPLALSVVPAFCVAAAALFALAARTYVADVETARGYATSRE